MNKMRTIITSMIILIFSSSLFAQGRVFEAGKIITRQGDTLNVLIGLETTYVSYVNYKSDMNSKIKKIKIKEIRTLSTPYVTYENIHIKKREELYRVLVTGPYTLLQRVIMNEGSGSNQAGGRMTYYSAPTIIYAIKSKDKTILLKKKKDKDKLLPILNKCPEVKAIIELKSFELKDLEPVIKKLNECNK